MDNAPLSVDVVSVISFLFLSTSGILFLLPQRLVAIAQHFSCGLQLGMICSMCLVRLLVDQVPGQSNNGWYIAIVCGEARLISHPG